MSGVGVASVASVGVGVDTISVGVGTTKGMTVEHSRISLGLGLSLAKMMNRVGKRMSIGERNGFHNGGDSLLNFGSFKCYSLWHLVVGVAISGIGVGNGADNLLNFSSFRCYNTWHLVGVGVAISGVGVGSMSGVGVAISGVGVAIVISVEDSRISFSLGLGLSLAKMMNSVSGISGIMSSISDGMVKSIWEFNSVSEGVGVWGNLYWCWYLSLDGWFHSLDNGGHCGSNVERELEAIDSCGSVGSAMESLLLEDAGGVDGNDSTVQVLGEANGLMLWLGLGHGRKDKACKNQEFHLRS